MNGLNRLRTWFPAALILAVVSAAWFAVFQPLDLKLLDQGFRWRRARRVIPSEKVVLVGVDEATYKAFPEPWAMWHRHLGDAFKGLAQAQPLGVGVDLNLPDKSYDALSPGLDAALMGGILMLRRACPLVVGLTVEADGNPRAVHPPVLTTLGSDGVGYVLWPLDGDNFVRRYDECLNHTPIPTLVGTLAHRVNLKTGPGYLDFSLGAPYDYVSLLDVVAWSREGHVEKLREHFQGKVVFLGSVLPLVDRHFMPVNLAGWEENGGFVPGVILHAQAMRCFLGSGLIKLVPAWVVGCAAALLALLVWVASGQPLRGFSTLVFGILAVGVVSFALLGRGWWLPPMVPIFGALAALVARTSLDAAMKLQERMRLRSVFGGYVSPAILKEILNGTINAGLRGERRTLCLVFSDIRNFTTLSETMAPEDVIALLNRYFTRMAEEIHRHSGTLDKFIGDGIMAFFGAPEPLENPCPRAFESAKAMLAALAELNLELEHEGRKPLSIGIGLHVGVAAVGHVGSEARHEYTAIGDVVNTASRIEGLTKETGYPLLVTAPVFERLGQPDVFDALGEWPIKGRSPMAVYGWPRR